MTDYACNKYRKTGKLLAPPRRLTASAPRALPGTRQFSIFLRSSQAVMNPALKASPAPMLSTTERVRFAAESINRWWQSAQNDYVGSQRLLILADGGGSNGVRCHAWKAFIQTRLADLYRIPVTVCHYPPGTPMWNPIEHRLFSEISKNLSGQPLDSYETIVNYICSTKTTSGLRVRARLLKHTSEKGITISKAQLEVLPITHYDTLSQGVHLRISPLARCAESMMVSSS